MLHEFESTHTYTLTQLNTLYTSSLFLELEKQFFENKQKMSLVSCAFALSCFFFSVFLRFPQGAVL